MNAKELREKYNPDEMFYQELMIKIEDRAISGFTDYYIDKYDTRINRNIINKLRDDGFYTEEPIDSFGEYIMISWGI